MPSNGSVILLKYELNEIGEKLFFFPVSLAIRFRSLWPFLKAYRNVTHHFGIGRPYWKRRGYDWCPKTAPSYLKNAVCRKSSFFRSPRLYVFGHCDRVFRPTEMLRTILESADQAEQNIFYHLLSPEDSFTLKNCGMPKKFIFLVSSALRFRSLWPCL